MLVKASRGGKLYGPPREALPPDPETGQLVLVLHADPNLPEKSHESGPEILGRVRDKKTFVMYSNHHHHDRLAFWCAAQDGAQERWLC